MVVSSRRYQMLVTCTRVVAVAFVNPFLNQQIKLTISYT